MSANLAYQDFVAAFRYTDEWPSLYIPGSVRSDRIAVLDALRANAWVPDLYFPEVAKEGSMISVRFQPIPDVQFDLQADDEQVVFLFYMQDLRDQAAVDAVCLVARTVGKASGRIVAMAAEDKNQSDPVIVYSPETDEFDIHIEAL